LKAAAYSDDFDQHSEEIVIAWRSEATLAMKLSGKVITIVKKRKSFVGRLLLWLWESGNPVFFAGFPSAVEKCFLLFHGAAFPQPRRR